MPRSTEVAAGRAPRRGERSARRAQATWSTAARSGGSRSRAAGSGGSRSRAAGSGASRSNVVRLRATRGSAARPTTTPAAVARQAGSRSAGRPAYSSLPSAAPSAERRACSARSQAPPRQLPAWIVVTAGAVVLVVTLLAIVAADAWIAGRQVTVGNLQSEVNVAQRTGSNLSVELGLLEQPGSILQRSLAAGGPVSPTSTAGGRTSVVHPPTVRSDTPNSGTTASPGGSATPVPIATNGPGTAAG